MGGICQIYPVDHLIYSVDHFLVFVFGKRTNFIFLGDMVKKVKNFSREVRTHMKLLHAHIIIITCAREVTYACEVIPCARDNYYVRMQ